MASREPHFDPPVLQSGGGCKFAVICNPCNLAAAAHMQEVEGASLPAHPCSEVQAFRVDQRMHPALV